MYKFVISFDGDFFYQTSMKRTTDHLMFGIILFFDITGTQKDMDYHLGNWDNMYETFQD